MSSNFEPETPGDTFVSEDELKGLLDKWAAPEPSKSLDQRVANSYHRALEGADAAARFAPFPQSQKEVVSMKFCSTCREEFADRFAFCPVDGTPLTSAAAVPQETVPSAVKFSEPAQKFSEPMVTPKPTPIMATAGAASSVAYANRDELHLTIIDDAGLLGRLAHELGDVAHEYQLTWPEFKRDPFGFTKRSLVGYGQMAGKFFGNRNILIALVCAVVAMVALVGIVSLLDSSQSAGMSRAGLITFSVMCALVLVGIFATWLRKNQTAAVFGAAESQNNNALAGVIAAFSVFLILVGGGVLWNVWQNRIQARQTVNDQLIADNIIEFPTEQPTPDEGTAGLNKGTGGGSKPKPEKAGGGGGGGREDPKPASFGKTPQASLEVPQVVAPDPKPPTIKNPSLPVAATVVADPLLVPPDARVLPYGDFKSKSMDPSSGPGTGNGIGTGRGGGIGPGEGGGIGPGRGGNIGGGDFNAGGGGPGGGGGGTDYNKVFSGKEVSSKARVLSKPEPQYTEEARKNQVTGTVVLRAVFTSGGQVTNIRAVSGLPYGLTERAIAAARQIKFVPATKDGRQVSMYIQLEYNFNLY